MSAVSTSNKLLTLHHEAFSRRMLGVSLDVMPSDHGIRLAVYVAPLCLLRHKDSTSQGSSDPLDRVGNAEGDEDDPVDANYEVDQQEEDEACGRKGREGR